MSEEDLLRAQLARTLSQEHALLELAALGDQPFTDRLRRILALDASTLEVARVSFWSFRADPSSIHCDELYRANSGHFECGLSLAEVDFPRYFEAMRTGKPIIASDAHRDRRTSEFSAGYLGPNGIGALLDVPVYVRGQLAGVVCHEHVGQERDWTADEQMFAMAVGQQVSLAIESRHRAAVEEALRDSETRFRGIVEAAPIPMLVTSFPEGICLYANQATGRVSGVSFDDMIGQRAPDFYERAEDRAALVAELASDGQVSGREVLFRRADGSTYWALVSLRRLVFDGRQAVIAGFWDLSRQKELEERLRYLALHDSLTGLPNRGYFFELLRNEAARAQRDSALRYGVLFIDLDGFKQVNDQHGHDIGDALLVEVANRLRACLRATDTAARVGGDEFTVLLVGVRDRAEANQAADRIADALAAPIRVTGHELTVGASIGVALGGESGDPGTLLRRADASMYAVKQRRRRESTTPAPR